MMIKIEDLPKKVITTVFEQGRASIDMTVDTRTGLVLFEGYIAGNYVPYSQAASIIETARAINGEKTWLD